MADQPSKVRVAAETAAGAGIFGVGCLVQCCVLAFMVAVGGAVLRWLGIL